MLKNVQILITPAQPHGELTACRVVKLCDGAVVFDRTMDLYDALGELRELGDEKSRQF